MLVVRAVEDIPDRGIKRHDEFRFYIVDAHHHMGREKGHRNTPPGAYDFYTQLWFELQKKSEIMVQRDLLLFEPVRVEAPEMASLIFDSRDVWKRMNHGWLVDRTTVFPYTDDYSAPAGRGEPSFKVSNDKIAGWTTRPPHSTRLIGYGRVNPTDGDSSNGSLAIKELERCVLELGLRGLKLHPLAQLFLDSIEGEATRNVVKKAGELGIPVIFDTRNIRTVERIHSLVESLRNDPDSGNALRGLSVILAHCGMSPGDPKLFDALKDPHIYAETSTLHDLDVPALFETARDRLGRSNDLWCSKILFGTDFSFLSVQAADVILYLLSREFSGSLADIQRILGGNALHLIQKPFSRKQATGNPPVEIFAHDKGRMIQEAAERKIAERIGAGRWGLASLDFMLPPKGTWPQVESSSSGGFNGVYLDSFLLTVQTQEGPAPEYHLWIRRRAGGLLSCSIVSTQGSTKIDTLEFASQKLSGILSKALQSNSKLAKNDEELFALLDSMIG